MGGLDVARPTPTRWSGGRALWEVGQMPDGDEQDVFDVVIIGGGPGGCAAALYAAAAGLSVALVEDDKLGGACLHRSCIPAKELLQTAAVYQTVQHAAAFGVMTRSATLEFKTSIHRANEVVAELFQRLSGLLAGRNVSVFEGRGELQAGGDVVVTLHDGSARTIAGTSTILATGSAPRVLPGFEPDGSVLLSSDDLLYLEEVPERSIVVGAGAVGCELASLLLDLGSKVTLLEVGATLLPGCDQDVADLVRTSFESRGMVVHTEVDVTGHHRFSGGTTVMLSNFRHLDTEAVVVSVGRAPASATLLADDVPVTLDDLGFVVVDEWMRTGMEGVYAIGDLVKTPQLAHVAYAEAILVVKQILQEPAVPIDYRRVPWSIYCHPEVAFCGMTEESARKAGLEVVVQTELLCGNRRTQILGETDGLVKVIAERSADGRAGRILGVHMVGPWVTEQLGQGYLAVNWEATPDDISQLLQPHPSLSEAFGETVLALTGRGLHVG